MAQILYLLRMKRHFLIFMISGQTFTVQFVFLEKPGYLFKLERNIRRKWKTHLPNINIFFERVKDMDRQFSPVLYLNDNDYEKYFEKLLIWKELNEKDHLSRRPFLAFEPCRHK